MDQESLHKLRKELFADGRLGAHEVDRLRAACEEMDKDTADFLFQLKDTLRADRVDKSFYTFFVEAISEFLLEDEDSPGEIDDTEAKWLRAKITRKGYVDQVDKQLLANLKLKSITYPQILSFKPRGIQVLETILFGQRFVTFLAVIGSMLASVILFVTSTLKVIEGFMYTLHNITSGHFEGTKQVVFFVEAIDGYLFATVLVIFSIGLYELFINKIDPVSLKDDNRPNWLKIHSIDDLKNSLAKVILMILIVSFFEHSIELNYHTVSDLLYLAVGTLLLSGALYLTHKGKH